MIWARGGLLSLIPSTRYVLAGLLVLAALHMIVFRPNVWTLPPTRLCACSAGSGRLPKAIQKTTSTSSIVTMPGVGPHWCPSCSSSRPPTPRLALDSIPAQFAVAHDPFLVLTANLFALFTAQFRPRSHGVPGLDALCKVGLALLLAYAAVATARSPDTMLSPELSLGVIAIAVSIGLGLALAFIGHHGPAARTSPLGHDAERLANTTLAQARKVIAFVIGGTIVIVGLVMVPGPGPGLLVLPVGLTILAMEFIGPENS